MRILKGEILKEGKIIIAGCMHSGSRNCHWKGIKRLVKRLKDPEVIGWLNTGDNIEGKIPTDKHWTPNAIDPKREIISPHDQADALIEVIDPIKHKILAWGRGNHEYRLSNTWDAGKHISNQLKVPYGMYTYKFHAMDSKGKTRFKIHIHHGNRSLSSNAKDIVQRKANKEAALRQYFFNTSVSDCILHAGSHWHQQIVSPPTYQLERHMCDNGKRHTQHYRRPTSQMDDYISPEMRWVASVGCFRKGISDPESNYEDYGEIAMYSGLADLGWVEVTIKNYQITWVDPIEAS